MTALKELLVGDMSSKKRLLTNDRVKKRFRRKRWQHYKQEVRRVCLLLETFVGCEDKQQGSCTSVRILLTSEYSQEGEEETFSPVVS